MAKALLLFFILAILFVVARWFLPIGPARALSGELLEVGRQRIALYGIDTAEDRLCAGTPCNALARQALSDLVADRYVVCLPYDRDAQGLFRGVCWAGGTELNDAMVRSGMAAASTTSSDDYVQAERAARDGRRGVWGGDRVPAAGTPRQQNGRVPLINSLP